MKKNWDTILEFSAAIVQEDWALFWEKLPQLDAEDLMWRDASGNHVMMVTLLHHRFEMAWVLMGKMMECFPSGEWVIASNKLNENALATVLLMGETAPLEAFLKTPILMQASSEQRLGWLSARRQKKPLAHQLAFNEYLKVWKKLERWEPGMVHIQDEKNHLPLHTALEKGQWEMASWLMKKTSVSEIKNPLWSVWEHRLSADDAKVLMEGWRWIFALNIFDWTSLDDALWAFWEKRGRQGWIREEFLEWVKMHPVGPQVEKKWNRFKQVHEWRVPLAVKKELWDLGWIGWEEASLVELNAWHEEFWGSEEERSYWLAKGFAQTLHESDKECIKKRL